jgi:hypothetical protein
MYTVPCGEILDRMTIRPNLLVLFDVEAEERVAELDGSESNFN